MSTRNNNKQNEETANAEQKDANAPNGANTGTGKQAPSYLAAALRVSSSRPLGAPRTDTGFLEGAVPNYYNTTKKPGDAPTPGAMVIDYIPTYGMSDGVTSALNRAVFNEFNAIRSKISGNRPYEPVDHMIYRACVSSMRELYHVVRRIYGIIRVYSATNLYRPRAILSAMGLDADSWIRNAAEVYQWLLTHKESLRPFPTVPIGSIDARHIAFDSYIFTDGDPETTQSYIINHKYFYSYEVVDEVKGISLREMPETWGDFCDMWDAMYRALQGSSDVYIIAADIRRAFEDRVITDLPDTPVDHRVEYVKLDSTLTSIMNASILTLPSEVIKGMFRIYDNGEGGLSVAPSKNVFGAGSEMESTPWYLPCNLGHINMVEATPAPETILEAVRLKPDIYVSLGNTPAVGGDMTISVQVRAMGTEVAVGCRILTLTNSGGTFITPLASCIAANDASQKIKMLAVAGQISNFDWHPPVCLWTFTTTYTESWNVLEDVQNYIPITESDLKNIHEATLLAEFGV